jgi:hypothetical protein
MTFDVRLVQETATIRTNNHANNLKVSEHLKLNR